MSYESFKNKETWLLNVWGYIDEIANEWIESDQPNGAHVSEISADYCKESFIDMVRDTLKKVPNGIISDFIEDALSTIDWREVAETVKDTVREHNDDR
jgi:hypothetical protein